MKTNAVWFVAALLASGPAWADEVVPIAQLPEAVRKSIEVSRHDEEVREVTRREIGGRTVYDVEFERRFAANPRLRVAEDGAVLLDTRRRQSEVLVLSPSGTPWPVLVTPRLGLEDLPAPVQDTVRAKARERRIAAIERGQSDGRIFYEVGFAQSGRNPRIRVAEDGTLLRDESSPKAMEPWTKGTQLADTPAAVQETIRREVGDRQIVNIDKDRRTGATVYEVQVSDAQGTFTLHIAEDGTVQGDSRQDGALTK